MLIRVGMQITKAGVPSNKILVGVTSYGRSFAMAEAGCYGPDCTYLGLASDFKATPGLCTQTAGYLANAEISTIIANSSRVTQNFLDSASNTNILVYDETQWVGWMDDSVKETRADTYHGLAMGGIADWATDLATFNNAPSDSSSWSDFMSQVRLGLESDGGDPFPGNRTGNWTTIQCTDPAAEGVVSMSPEERWNEMDCPNAWSDAINFWYLVHPGDQGLNFSETVADMFHFTEHADCGQIIDSGCEYTQCETGVKSGAAAFEIWNSFVIVNKVSSTSCSEHWLDRRLLAF